MPTPVATDTRWRVRLCNVAVLGAVVCQIVFLFVAGWRNRYVLESDTIPLVRIAWYYATGQFNLAVAGYWGPLFSWLTIPWLAFTEHPIDAGRITMGLSALVFLLGCVAVFRSLDLPPAGVVLGTWVVAIWTVFFTADGVTADLLVSGLLCLAISRMLSPRWLSARSWAFVAGLLCGAAYLTKAIAFPITLALNLAIAGLWMASHQVRAKDVIRSVAFTLLGFAVLAAPWVVVLSIKYHSPTFTISGRIAHTLVGPNDVDRYHPFRSLFHQPEKGRLFSWEEPSTLPYRYWSPLESPAYARHQIEVIEGNFHRVFTILREFDVLGLGVLALIGGVVMPKPWAKRLRMERWRWAIVPVVCLTMFYLPVYAAERRYYFPTYPFLLASSIGLVGWLSHQAPTRRRALWLVGLGLVIGSFAAPALARLPKGLNGLDRPSVHAHALAQKLRAANICGPIASVGSKAGLFVAFFLNQPWYGEEGQGQSTTVARVKASQAHLIIVDRRSPLITEMDNDPAFRGLDRLLVTSEVERRRWGWKAYQLRAPSGAGDNSRQDCR